MLTPSCACAFSTFLRYFLSVSALLEGGNGVGCTAQALADPCAQRAHVPGVGVEEGAVGAEYIAGTSRFCKGFAVYKEGLCVGFLQVHYREEHGFHLGLYVVSLVDHVAYACIGSLLG